MGSVTLITSAGPIVVSGENLVIDLQSVSPDPLPLTVDGGRPYPSSDADSAKRDERTIIAGRGVLGIRVQSEQQDASASQIRNEPESDSEATATSFTKPASSQPAAPECQTSSLGTPANYPDQIGGNGPDLPVEAATESSTLAEPDRTNTEMPAAPALTPSQRQAGAPEASSSSASGAAPSTGATVATGSAGGPDSAPVKVSMKKMRPYCQHPGSDKCGGYSHKHCYSCTKLMREREREEAA